MRRKEKQINLRSELEKIIKRANVVRIALTDNLMPYIVPLNFGYSNNTLYFHSAKEGRKMDIIKKNNNVAFEIDIDNELIKNEIACKFTMNYRSVIGNGKAIILTEKKDIINGLNVIMNHYTDVKNFEYNDKVLDKIYVVKIEINEMTGKQSGYKEFI
jgi:nitroimidazol reductase NimA-like FMN-containing flavoprotein (pyridoxamine 5'-phosphate oxidase superfamily)